MGRHHYVPLRHRHDIPIRRREDVPLRRCWMFHLRLTCDIAETYKETPCRRVGNFMREKISMRSMNLGNFSNLMPGTVHSRRNELFSDSRFYRQSQLIATVKSIVYCS